MSVTSKTPAALEAGTYRIDPGTSKIHFTTKHMFGTGSVKGSFSQVTGDIVVAEDLSASAVVAAAPAQTFDTQNPKRDEKVLSGQLLDGETHRHLQFASTAMDATPEGWVLRGNLTVAGGTAPLELRVTRLEPTPGGVDVTATGSVDRYAHGVTAMKGMIGRRLDFSLVLTAAKA